MLDLTNKVTVFVISTGEDPNYFDCIDALSHQTVQFSLDIIKGYAPMSAAFQQMLDRCTTDYFIQVDEDMILKPDAIQTLYTAALERVDFAMVCFYLHDVYDDLPIQGIKIYNHKIFVKFPYNFQDPSCEMEQLNRIKKAGYNWYIDKKIIGEHSPKWTTKGIFSRYYNCVKKQRYFNSNYGFGDLQNKAIKHLEKEINGVNLFAFLGASIAKNDSMDNFKNEKNFKILDPNYEKCKELFPSLVTEYKQKKFKIALLAEIPCANTMFYTNQLINNYSSKYESRYILGSQYWKDRTEVIPFREFPVDLDWATQKEECIAIIKEADIIHIKHNFFLNTPEMQELLKGKKVIITICDLDMQHRPNYLETLKSVASIIVVTDQPAQKRVFGNIADYFSPLVNLIPEVDERKANPKPRVVFSPTNRYPITNPSSKGYYEIIEIIKQLKDEGIDFDFDLVEGVSHEEDLNHKRSADIIIDDIINATWHNTSLQAAHFGAISLTGYSAPDHPFIETTLATLKDRLKFFLTHPEDLSEEKIKIIDWCKKYNTPEFLLSRYENIYDTLLIKNRNIKQEVHPQIMEVKKDGLNILRLTDEWNWAYDHIARDMAKFSKHNVTCKRLKDMKSDDMKGINILYIPGPNMGKSQSDALIQLTRTQFPKCRIIGGYAGEHEIMYPNMDMIVSISAKFYPKLKEMYASRKTPVVFLPESVDTEFFVPGQFPNDFIIGWAGRIGDVKRTHLLDQLGYPIKKQSDHGKKFFEVPGRTLQPMKDFYQSLSALVLVSRTEAMPRVVLEAMACGLPIVSTDVGSLRMLLEPEWLVPVNPEVDTITEMKKKLKNLESPIEAHLVGDRNRKFIHQNFSWSVNQPIWDAFFDCVGKGHFTSAEIYNKEYRTKYGQLEPALLK